MFVKQTVAGWAKVTTWHGVADIYNAHSHGPRLFWLCLVLSVTVLAAYQINLTVTQYLKGTGYTTSIYFSRFPSINIPPITICNNNKARASVADSLNMTNSQIEAFYSAILGNYIFTWKSFVSSHPEYANDLKGLLAKLAHRCDDMIILVKLYGTPTMYASDLCNNTDFVTTVQTLYGQCYSLTGSMVQTIEGRIFKRVCRVIL